MRKSAVGVKKLRTPKKGVRSLRYVESQRGSGAGPLVTARRVGRDAHLRGRRHSVLAGQEVRDGGGVVRAAAVVASVPEQTDVRARALAHPDLGPAVLARAGQDVAVEREAGLGDIRR